MKKINCIFRRFKIVPALLVLASLVLAFTLEVQALGQTPDLVRTSLFYRPDLAKAKQSDDSTRKDIASALESVVNYMNKARDTGDDSYYDQAESELNKILKIDPENYDALRLKAWVQSGRHHFTEALASAKRASKLRPYDSSNYGVMVDALVELGRYKEAVDAAQRMVDLKPGMAAYSRIAYLRWLHGDPQGAEEMMRKAVDAGPPNSSETAWCIVQLGDEYFKQGQLAAAEAQYKRVLETFPDYIHALAGMGKVKVAHRDYKAAIKFYRQAVDKNPTHAYVVALGDVYALNGDEELAKEQYDLVKRMAKAKHSNPETGLKMAIFYTEHDENLSEALELAKRDADSSEDIQAWDALAWAYYKNGQYDKAGAAMKKALRLDTKDAGLFFHAGMIYRSQGDNERAKKYLEGALSINPYFDLQHALIAKDTLKEIEKERIRADKVYNLMLIIVPVGAALAVIAIIWSRKPNKTRKQR